MKVFRTHLIVSQNESQKIISLRLENFRFILKEEPSECFWEGKDGTYFSHYSRGLDPKYAHEDEIPQKELLIEAESQEKAEDLFSIIIGGILLAYPDPIININNVLKEYIEGEDSWYKEEPYIKYLKRIDNVWFGCKIASLVINNKQLIYAIEKYKVSLDLTSFTPKSADPIYGQVFDNYDTKHNYHTRSAFAIISAFSVIEELGLEVRSSSSNRRFLNNKTGEWNPRVLDNIMKRLEESNISNDLTFDWIYRGEPTKIEKK